MEAERLEIRDPNVFEMHFNRPILLEQLIRSGNEKEAVHADLRVDDPVNVFEAAMRNPDGPEPVVPDFVLDQDGLIDPQRSSGKNLCSL